MIESKNADTATMLGKEYTFFLSNDNSLNEFYYSYQLYSPGLSDSGMPLVSLTKITEKIGKIKKWGEKGETTSSLPYGKGSDILQYLMGSGKEKKQYHSFLKTVLRKEGVNIFSSGDNFPNIEMIFGEKNSLQKSVIIHLRDLNRWKNFRFLAGKQIDLLYSPTEFIVFEFKENDNKELYIEPVAAFKNYDSEMKNPLKVDFSRIMYPTGSWGKDKFSEMNKAFKLFEWESFTKREISPRTNRVW